MSGLSIGLSALAVNQRLMELAGQNIANAQTKGYHRQIGLLAGRVVGLSTGAGVEITEIIRARSGLLETAIRTNTSEVSNASGRLETLQQLETILAPGPGSILDLTSQFFNQMEELGNRPADLSLRRGVLNTAVTLAGRLNAIEQDLVRVQEGLVNEAELIVGEVNSLASQIAGLNGRIATATLMDQSPNDLRDQREQLLSRLAEFVDTRIIEQDHGQINVLAAGLPLVSASQTVPVELRFNQDNEMYLAAADTAAPLLLSGGKLDALFELANSDVTTLRAQLSEFTREFTRHVDGVQATGLGLTGSLSFVNGLRAAADVTVPLAQAGLELPVQAGSLFVGVTDQATGLRTLHEVAIDPATQSVQDVAAAITAGVPNVQAVVNTQTGTISLIGQTGFAFDFAGRLPSVPQTSTLTGTATARLASVYTGAANDQFTFRFIGTGTIGVTSGLKLEVRDSLNQVIATLNVGQGYEAGALLGAGHGVQVRISTGTVNNGETFGTQVIAEPDGPGILAALGLNTFFASSAPGDVRVREELLNRPDFLAASRSGETGDNGNVQRFVRLRDARLFKSGTETFESYYTAIVTDMGFEVREAGQRREALSAVGDSLEAEQQSVSGVDPNEELTRLLGFQRAYQMSAQYIAVINETFDALLGIL
jgi:flagellar hook-associated protein 1 FlgK